MELMKNNLNRLPLIGLDKNYKIDIKIFNKWLNGRTISSFTLSQFFAERLKVCKPSTIRRNKASIKAALRLALGNNITLDELAQFKAFFDEIKPGKVNLAITDEKIVTKEERTEILKICGWKTGLLINALFQTATRISELLAIELKNCKHGRHEITIEIYRQKTKTIDHVYIKKELLEEIKTAYPGTRYLFEKDGKPLSRFTAHRLIKNAGLKIGRDIHCHLLRHSWASAAIPVLGLAKVSKYLGHSRPDTTSRYYLHGRASEEEITAFNALQLAD